MQQPNTVDGFDPVEMEVFSNRLLSITDEMGEALIRSSFSTNIKERRDCSVGLFDASGRLLAQASHIPIHLGSLQGGVQTLLKEIPFDEIHDGDAFICNDPYLAGGTHIPDITIITPIFVDGTLEFFAANIGHHTDMGGPVPGSISRGFPNIFSEGLRIPLIRIVKAGELDVRLLDLIAHNTRDPLERILDLKVQIAVNRIGAEGMLRLARRMSLPAMHQTISDLIRYTEQRLAGRIAALDDGVYTGEAFLDSDGVGDTQLRIAVAVTVAGSVLNLDFTGTSPQAAGAINVPQGALNATVLYAIKTLLDPQLPPNEALMSTLSINAPRGSLLNPEFPAAVGSRSSTCQRVVRAIFHAMAHALPENRVIAASNDTNDAMLLSGTRPNGGGQFVYLETIGGGGGARRDDDGMHGVQCHITNTSNLPAEAMEIEYPLLVKEYGLVDHSGGRGRTCGGAGIVREVMARGDGIRVSSAALGQTTPAPGLFGGGEGGLSRLAMRDADGVLTRVPKLANVALPAGHSIRMETPGGGGFGPVAERSPERVAFDIEEGLVNIA